MEWRWSGTHCSDFSGVWVVFPSLTLGLLWDFRVSLSRANPDVIVLHLNHRLIRQQVGNGRQC